MKKSAKRLVSLMLTAAFLGTMVGCGVPAKQTNEELLYDAFVYTLPLVVFDATMRGHYQTDIGKLNITPSTADWTNGNVELEISYTKEIPTGYAIEYKVNNGSWQEGTRVVVEENNTKVTTRLYSKEKNNEALSNSYTVSKEQVFVLKNEN